MKCNKGLTLIRIVRKARYQRRKVCVKMEIRYGCIKSYINLDKNSEESQILEKKGLHEDGNKEWCINHIYINLDKNSKESQEQEKKGLHEDENQQWCMNCGRQVVLLSAVMSASSYLIKTHVIYINSRHIIYHCFFVSIYEKYSQLFIDFCLLFSSR